MHKFVSILLKVVLIGAIVLLLYKDEVHRQPMVDFENTIDQFVDAGFHPNISRLEEELLNHRKIVITTGINAFSSKRIIEGLLLLNARDKNASIDLFIRTEGGWEADAFSIIDTIGSIQAPVNVHAIGDVHSSGLIILAAGTGERFVYENTVIGFHSTEADDEEPWKSRYKSFLDGHSKLPPEWLSREDGSFEYFTAVEAIEYKVADRLITSKR